MQPVNTVRTVSETKRAFYTVHTRPINSIFRRVVEELMVEMHLLSVNPNFRYDPIYALGVVTSFQRFMQGYRPEADQASIFNGLCQAIGSDPQQYQRDAAELAAIAKELSPQDLIGLVGQTEGTEKTAKFRQQLEAIASNAQFKYSRLFAIGLFSLLELANPEASKDEQQRVEFLTQFCQALHIPTEKLQKDLDLYRSNLEKMNQARLVMEDLLKADRKQREQRNQNKNGTATPQETASSPAKDEASSGS